VHRLATSFVLGYHGCSEAAAEALLSGASFEASDNDYDWLGPGIYFWQSNPHRALQFAEEKRARENASWKPFVVGAVIDLRLCLDLTTKAGIEQVKAAHQVLLALFEKSGEQLPTNAGGTDRLLRRLDCAVIRLLHAIRDEAREPSVSTVVGIFTEGGPAYDGAAFAEKTHTQVCVRDKSCIRGVFRVPRDDLVD